jgi:hypothetical protein
MKKLLIGATVLLLLVQISCKKDGQTSILNNPSVLLKNYSDPSGREFLDYTYSGNSLSRLTHSGYSSYYSVYSYTGNLIAKMEQYSPSNVLGGHTDFTYANGKLSQIKIYKSTILSVSYSFVYNIDETTDVTTKTYDSSGLLIGSDTEKNYYDSAGNVVRVVSGNLSWIYTYDTKNNPLKNVVGCGSLVFQNWYPSIKNNMLTRTDYNGATKTYSISYTYQYNDQGYPITASKSYNGNSPSVITYSY